MFKLTLSFKGRILKAFPLAPGQTLIGRAPDCDIQIENLGVSPQHVRIDVDGDHALLVDTSADGAGVLVNGKPVSEHELQHGDEILVGKHTLSVARSAEPAAPRPAPTLNVPARNGWLQFLNGPKLGRTIRLDRNLVRLGKSGKQSAMIASRPDGYYISHLEGEEPTLVRGAEIDAQSHKLNDGDTIRIGDVEMLFFLRD